MLQSPGAVVAWLLAIELLGLAALPLTARLFPMFPDRGYAFSKMLALLVVAYAAWVTAILGLTAFTGATVIALTLLLGATSWVLWGKTVVAGWSTIRRMALAAEGVFVTAFLGAAWIRSYSPAIAGQEKQMDLTFLHSLIRTASLPAEDFWLAGFGMPYYYFGYLTQSIIAKATLVDPSVAYNLAMASILALAAVGAFGVAAGLVHLAGRGYRDALAAGLLAAFGLTIMGNLQAFFEWVAATGFGDAAFWRAVGIKNLQAHSLGFPPTDGIWWFRAARVIPNIEPDGITEFPYFSFLLNDLHPHYMAIPLAVLIVGFAIAQLMAPSPIRQDRLRLAVAAVVLGAVIPSNTWDVPVLWGLFGLALLAPALRAGANLRESLGAAVLDVAAVFGLAIGLYVPYFVGYVSQSLGLGLVQERTYFGTLLVLFGPLVVLPFAAGLAGVLVEVLGRGATPLPSPPPQGGRESDAGGRPTPNPQRLTPIVGGAGLIAFVMLALLREPTLGFLLACLAFWIPLVVTRARRGDRAGTGVALLAVLGVGSILVAEVVFLRDVFNTRMNTVFKFYYDAWIVLALVAPSLAWELVGFVRTASIQPGTAARAREGRFGAGSYPWAYWLKGVSAAGVVLAGGLALGGLVYPLAATSARSSGFATAPTLDGMVHLRSARADDVAVVEWLRQQRRERTVVVEAVGNDYTDAGRFSTFAGVPTLVGWTGHEVQWRGGNPEIDRRRRLAESVYTTDPDASTMRALAQIGAEYIVVGGLERELYGPDAGSRLADRFRVAHRVGGTTVYSLGGPPQIGAAP